MSIRNKVAGLAIEWVYNDVYDDTPQRLGFPDFESMYDASQREDFTSFSDERYHWDDEGEERWLVFNAEDYRLSERDTLNLMFHYASRVVFEITGEELED